MSRRVNRSGSISPSSSVDSISRRRQVITKKTQSSSLKSSGDVQVFTSLPPNVEGEIKFTLKLEIAKINLLVDNPVRAGDQSSKSKNIKKNTAFVKEAQLLTDAESNVIAQCVWWGEDESRGSIFRPRILVNGEALKKERKIQTNAKYVVRSGIRQFNAYLNDMKTLDIDLINENSMVVIGRVQIHEIGQLSQSDQIKGIYTAFDEFQLKVAEVYVSIHLVSPKDPHVSTIQNTSSKITTKPVKSTSRASLDNITDFNTKFNLFENQQLNKLDSQQVAIELAKAENKQFNSTTYLTTQEPASTPKNPIISNLIERAETLRNEMIKSATNQPMDLKTTHPLTTSNSSMKIPFEHSFILPNQNHEFDSFNEFIDNDFSRLSDPMHDPEILSALIYNQHATGINDTSTFADIQQTTSFKLDDEDKELKALLQPTDELLMKVGTTDTVEKKHQNKAQVQLDHIKKYLKSISSDENFDNQKETNSFNRVSFEIQSSDNETSASSIGSDTTDANMPCVDSLCPQRLALLNLVQLAKLKVEKVTFISNANSLTKIIEKTNSMDQQNSDQKHRNRATTSQKSKPPRSVKTKTPNSDLFFIEYQFPIVATSRETDDQSLMATQAMRVVSKRPKPSVTSDDTVQFDHNADYSVLFNSQSLESWWRSSISFKVYCRSSVAVGQTQTPYLIGHARLSLKNALKSKNFKLLKRLAVYDTFNSQCVPQYGDRKRIGTLHVSIELASDLHQFQMDLVKLKNYELKFLRNKKLGQMGPKARQVVEEPVGACNPTNKSKQVVALKSASLGSVVMDKQQSVCVAVKEEFSVPINMYLTINEGRGFKLDANVPINANSEVYLVCRLFWCKEKIKFESNSSWSLNLSFLLKPALIENMKNNFMIIEAYQNNSKHSKTDTLIGTIKLPLHEFYLKFRDYSAMRQFLTETTNFTQPLIGVNGWVSSHDPFTGVKSGEINVMLAMGSGDQITNLQKLLFDQAKTRVKSQKVFNPPENSVLNWHTFGITLDALKLQPIKSVGDEDLNENKCFVKYEFLVGESADSSVSATSYIQPLRFMEFSIASLQNVDFQNYNEHRFLADKKFKIKDLLTRKYYSESINASEDFTVTFEVWSRTHSPSPKEKCIAHGQLALSKLLNISEQASSVRSFIIPLISADNSLSDKFLGQLSLSTVYKRTDHYMPVNLVRSIRTNSNCDDPMSSRIETAILNIGVLRAYRLESLVKALAAKNGLGRLNLDSSDLYVKFSLSFIDRAHECKRTQHVLTSLNGYSPEFFDYFDVCCPLVAPYNSTMRRTVSLAEQLEQGQLIFEIWSKFIDPRSQTSLEALLGTCNVPLEPLLENRIGIRGWLPIQAFNGSTGQNSANGGLEVVIRFTRHDDYLKIIDTAKDIGWSSVKDYETSQNSRVQKPTMSKCDGDFMSKLVLSDQTMKCLIEIERAVRLPLVGNKLIPNAYVSFLVYDGSDSMRTSVCEKLTAPKWNFQYEIDMDVEYFLNDEKLFELQVWHRNEVEHDQLIGVASIDLTPLVYGLSHITGWYNIQDTLGNCQGQIKLSFIPKENLSKLRELKAVRKKTLTSDTKRNFHSSRFTTNSHTSLNIVPPLDPIHPHSSTSTNNLTESATTDAKSDLAKNLSELDQFNQMFKERLSRHNVNEDLAKFVKAQAEKCLRKTEAILNESPKPDQDLTENARKSLVKFDPVINFSHEAKEPIKTDRIENEETKSKVTEQPITEETTKPADFNENLGYRVEVYDSFWVSSVQNEESQESIDISGIACDKTEDKVDYLPPICHPETHIKSIELNDDSNKPVKDMNDTDVDQTFNLNASYEIISRKKSFTESQMMETYDMVDNEVDNVIDCAKVDTDDEILRFLNDTEQKGGDEFNESIASYEPDFEDDQNAEENRNDENLTVLVPEQLNRIDTVEQTNQEKNQEISGVQNASVKEIKPIEIPVKEDRVNCDNNDQSKEVIEVFDTEEILTNKVSLTSIEDITPKTVKKENPEIDISEKFKLMSTKMPNYFLPQEDMEKSMKKLYENFPVRKPDSIESRMDRVMKTTDIIKNHATMKKDLDRINKIFHS